MPLEDLKVTLNVFKYVLNNVFRSMYFNTAIPISFTGNKYSTLYGKGFYLEVTRRVLTT